MQIIDILIARNKDRRSSKFASRLLTKSSVLPSKSSFLIPKPPSFHKKYTFPEENHHYHSSVTILFMVEIAQKGKFKNIDVIKKF